MHKRLTTLQLSRVSEKVEKMEKASEQLWNIKEFSLLSSLGFDFMNFTSSVYFFLFLHFSLNDVIFN